VTVDSPERIVAMLLLRSSSSSVVMNDTIVQTLDTGPVIYRLGF
jgi:hypothetical protein